MKHVVNSARQSNNYALEQDLVPSLQTETCREEEEAKEIDPVTKSFKLLLISKLATEQLRTSVRKISHMLMSLWHSRQLPEMNY